MNDLIMIQRVLSVNMKRKNCDSKRDMLAVSFRPFPHDTGANYGDDSRSRKI